MRRTRTASIAAIAAVASVVIAACGSSSSGGSHPGSSSSPSGPSGAGVGFQKLSTNDTGTPVKGGVLNLAGTSDVDYMDPNITYYTVGYEAARLYSRQLYTYPGVVGQATDAVPDIATSLPTVSADGKTFTITIKQGVMWNTSPARQVSAADVVRGTEITCNPSQPFGGTPDFASLIVGYKSFCAAFAKAPVSVAGIKSFLASHTLSGVTVDPSDPETVVFHLTQPATYFTNMLALPAFSPRPVEMLNYLPASQQEAQHTISDGPYEIKSYSPTKSIDFVRNPAWNASTDTIRKAWVNEIKVTLGVQQTAIQQQILAGSVDLSWDLGPPPNQDNSLIQSNNPYLNVQSEIASNPYIVFNTQSPNNSGALGKVAVRQALSYAIDRSDLLQDAGGPDLAPPLTHVLPSQIDGAPTSTTSVYPYDPTKAEALLKAAGASGITLKFLYRPSSSTSTAMFQDLQSQLKKVGITLKGVTASESDFYVKYLEQPGSARRGEWDLSLAGWGPDWYGNAALSFFAPLFDGRTLPPLSSNFGLFNDPAVNTLIDTASKATSLATSNADWAAADNKVIQDAAIYPIEDDNTGLLRGANVHDAVFLPALQNFDFTNVWLSGS
jgi:peptide/nickel transport system substrate-binding protein